MASIYVYVILYTSVLTYCYGDPFSYGAAVLGSAFVTASIASWKYMNCHINECCSKPWIQFDELSLKENLQENVYGQHLVQSTVVKSLRGFLRNENPQKALVMSFHGLTGSGKNYVSSMIAKSLYKKGMESSYVHMYVANLDFPHEAKVSEYQDRLREDLVHYTKQCERSLFIFDEVDKMPGHTLDVLKPFIDHHEHIDNVVYRKNIFVFLSNTGSRGIVRTALEFWSNGQEREEITMRVIEPLISKGAYNEIGGFKFSELLSSALVDAFVPFLPLEKKHVRMCIEAELKKRSKKLDKKMINEIADELVYFPKENELFSESGCKRISQKIDSFIDD